MHSPKQESNGRFFSRIATILAVLILVFVIIIQAQVRRDYRVLKKLTSLMNDARLHGLRMCLEVYSEETGEIPGNLNVLYVFSACKEDEMKFLPIDNKFNLPKWYEVNRLLVRPNRAKLWDSKHLKPFLYFPFKNVFKSAIEQNDQWSLILADPQPTDGMRQIVMGRILYENDERKEIATKIPEKITEQRFLELVEADRSQKVHH